MNNRTGRPFEEKALTAYSDPVKTLDRWMSANGIAGDFDAADTALLNRFFREYYLEHGQGAAGGTGREGDMVAYFLTEDCPLITDLAGTRVTNTCHKVTPRGGNTWFPGTF